MDTNYKMIKNMIKTAISDLKSYTCNEGDDGANRFAQRHEQLIRLFFLTYSNPEKTCASSEYTVVTQYEWYRNRVREFIAKYQIVLLFQATTQIQGLPNILFFPFGSTLPNNDKNLLDHTSELNDDHTNNGDED
jgi:hypothetical protein